MTASDQVSAGPLDEAMAGLELDIDALVAATEAVLAQELTWFPVRHHSPTAARHVGRLIRRRKPKLVLIEGPAQANAVIPHLIDPATKPPVAIYCSYRDDDDVLGLAGISSPAPDVPARFASWFPMLDYSPELVAMRTAAKVGAEIAFIDLPFHAQLRAREAAKQDDAEDEADEPPQPPEALHSWEEAVVDSNLYQRLTELAGYRSWDEAWDALFELGDEGDDVLAFRRRLALFCAAARATVPRARLEADGTLPRERFMARQIRAELEARGLEPKDAVVVCGGFHLFLEMDDPVEPPEAPPGTVHSTVTPYSFYRVSELSGYQAGNRAPRFYQRLWERGDHVDALLDQTIAVFEAARRRGEPHSAADAIAVTHHTRMLAGFRARSQPVLDDLHDALLTCCVKGTPTDEGAHLLAAMDAAAIGKRIGKVTGAIGRLPILRDFHDQLERHELEETIAEEGSTRLTLDTRDAADRGRSLFLRRLDWLDVGFASPIEHGGLGGALFSERWMVAWSPNVEPNLIELNLYGDTIEAATLSKLEEALARAGQDAATVGQQLVDAVDLDLPHLLPRAEAACATALDEDSRLISLGQAFVHLRVVARVAEHRASTASLATLPELLQRAFARACFAIGDAASSPDDDHPALIEALKALAEAVIADPDDYDRELLVDHLTLAAADSPVPRLRGVFLGTLAELRALDADQLAAEVASYALLTQERLVEAGALLEGMLVASRTSILLGADALVGAIDQLLDAAEWTSFLTMLPSLRAAFEHLHPAQRDALAETVAARFGLREGRQALRAPLETSDGAAVAIARADARVAAILEAWGL